MNGRNDMHNLLFTEETDKDPSRLELWQTNENKLRITMEPAEDDDYMRFMCIELDLSDVIVLANEVTRIAKLMQQDANAMRTHATASEPPEGNAIPAWRQKEKVKQLKLLQG